jgi:uncharacterized membrane protein YeiB
MVRKKTKPSNSRILGYDFARALAIFGMVVVNFKIVMGASQAGPDWLVWLVGLLEGRAAATFVILAGVGMSLLSRRAWVSNDTAGMVKNRNMLLKRAMFLFVAGLLYIPIWPADILHFYGIYIAVGAFLLIAPERRLWRLAFIFMGVSVVLMLLFDYESGWNWGTLDYAGFWTPTGMVRHLFFNGFHPVFPWTAFLLVGLWLGRQDVHDPALRKKMLRLSIIIVVLAESVSWLLIQMLSAFDLDPETVAYLFGTQPMPPMPLYLLSGGGTAVAAIMLSIALTERLAAARWIKAFVATGQLALTLYVAHVILGMGVLEALGLLENQSLPFAVGSALLFCVGALLFSFLWRQRFNRGPLEWVMRRLTG